MREHRTTGTQAQICREGPTIDPRRMRRCGAWLVVSRPVFEDRLIGESLKSIFNGLVADDLIAVCCDHNPALDFPASCKPATRCGLKSCELRCVASRRERWIPRTPVWLRHGCGLRRRAENHSDHLVGG